MPAPPPLAADTHVIEEDAYLSNLVAVPTSDQPNEMKLPGSAGTNSFAIWARN